MFGKETSGLLKRCCVLLTLLVCLGVFSSSPASGKAAVKACCSTCEPELQECYVRSCHCDPVTGICPPGSQTCISRCNFYFDYCEIHCTPGC